MQFSFCLLLQHCSRKRFYRFDQAQHNKERENWRKSFPSHHMKRTLLISFFFLSLHKFYLVDISWPRIAISSPCKNCKSLGISGSISLQIFKDSLFHHNRTSFQALCRMHSSHCLSILTTSVPLCLIHSDTSSPFLNQCKYNQQHSIFPLQCFCKGILSKFLLGNIMKMPEVYERMISTKVYIYLTTFIYIN